MALLIVYDAAAAIQEQTVKTYVPIEDFWRRECFAGFSTIFGASR